MLDTVILQPVMQTKGFLMSLLTLTYVRLNSLKLKKKIKADLQKKKVYFTPCLPLASGVFHSFDYGKVLSFVPSIIYSEKGGKQMSIWFTLFFK